MEINEWLPTQIGKDIWENKYRHNGESLDEFFDRISDGDQHIRRLLIEKKFLPAGRTLANRGIKNKKISYSNCYYIKAPDDNIEDIFRCATEIARTFSYGGGCGTDISNLSPAGAKINNAAKFTSGATSFMDLFSLVTELIAQNGRRGALMISLDCNHPDLIDFIQIKQNTDRVTKANISIKITDEFMKAVENDSDWTMSFNRPETGENIKKTISARKILRLIAESNHDWAEPGILFWDNIKNWNMLSHNKDYKLTGTNPCAEQPLNDYGSCNLCSFNLSQYVRFPFTELASFNFYEFYKDVGAVVDFMDKVMEENIELHPLQSQKETVMDWRPIGIGVMGFAETLIKLDIRYKNSSNIIDEIGEALLSAATNRSIELAIEKGAYPKFTMDGFKSDERNFINTNLIEEEINGLKKYGMRNATLISIAPTGSLSNMLGVSGGIEPLYDTHYIRKTESLYDEGDKYYTIYAQIVEERGTGTKGIDISKKIHYEDRIKIQAQWQKYCDTAISSTINLPKKSTIEEIEEIIKLAHNSGLKGITIYRDKCKRSGILTSDRDEDGEELCPDCSGIIKYDNGCKSCIDCGWGACSL